MRRAANMEAMSSKSGDFPRYGVVGAGLVGNYLGGLLALGGRRVTLVGRGPIGGDLARHGMRLTDYRGWSARPEGFVFVTDMAALAGCDVILVCVKSPDTDATARALDGVIAHNALVVSFQNGVRNARTLRERLPERTVLPGLVPFNVTSPEPGRFHKATQGDLFWRTAPGRRVLDMQAAFREAGQAVELRDPMLGLQWGKLLLNLNNALNVLQGGPLREGLRQRGYRRVLAAMIGEGVRALAAADIRPEAATRIPPARLPGVLRLPNPLFTLAMDRVATIDASARSSMLEDLERGRASENDWIQGELIRLARRGGVSVEVNRRVGEAVEAAFAVGTSPRMSGREMAERFLGR